MEGITTTPHQSKVYTNRVNHVLTTLALGNTSMPTERMDPRQYNLSEKQLAYLLNEDIGTRNPARIEEDLQEATSQQGTRLQYLIEDICTLYAEGYIDEWSNSWEELTNIQRKDPCYNEPIKFIPPDQDYPNPQFATSDYLELAIYLGHICRILYSSAAPDYDETTTAIGFLVGLTGGWLKDDPTAPTAAEKFTQDLPEKDTQMETFRMPTKETHEELSNVLKDIRAAEKKERVMSEGDIRLRECIEDSDLTLTPPLFSHAREKHWNQGGPQEISVHQFVEELESTQVLRQCEHLADLLCQDIETLLETTWKGERAINIFLSIDTADNLQDPKDVASAADAERQLVSKLLNDLQGREEPWEERPLITKEVDYLTTSYGTLIGEIISADDERETIPSRDDIISAVHAHAVEHDDSSQRELVENALLEVDINT